jgi:hypothetical protein
MSLPSRAEYPYVLTITDDRTGRIYTTLFIEKRPSLGHLSFLLKRLDAQVEKDFGKDAQKVFNDFLFPMIFKRSDRVDASLEKSIKKPLKRLAK